MGEIPSRYLHGLEIIDRFYGDMNGDRRVLIPDKGTG